VSTLKVFLFGPPRIEKDNQPIEIKRRKTLALFAYLVVSGEPYSRDALATLFWPENDQSGARANLRRDISRLKRTLGEDALLLDGDNLSRNPDYDLWLDLESYQSKLDEAASHDHPSGSLCPVCSSALTEAVKLYTDSFMAGFNLPDSPEFDDWQFFQAEGLRRTLAEALQKLINWHIANREFGKAIVYARRWLALDNLHEPAHQTLMRLYAWNGEQASAIRQYKESARLLREKLGLEPDAETLALYKAIQTKQVPPPTGVGTEEFAQPTAPTLKSAPPDMSPFIGREKEISELVDKLRHGDTRLVTIVALGGTGKTRLSVEAARRFLLEHPAVTPEGGVFIALASVDKPDAVPYAIARDMGFSLSGQIDPLAELVNSLRKRRMLLVLDNFEQLVEGASLLQDILSDCPGIKMLVTSREPLRLSFEWRVDLDGLPYPGTDATDADDLEAVQLFLQSAGQASMDFGLDDDTRPLVYRLCETLGGMPLAIKLAANWLRAMSLEQIVTEVERSLDILTSQMRDIPDRQRSMNAVFQATWEMLSSEEQRAFASLAVFRGGFSPQAAQQVAEVSPYLLAGLVDHGLVRLGNGGRYEIHELTRQFATAKQKEDEEVHDTILERHSRYYLDFVIREGPNLYGQNPQDSLAVLKKDLANIRYAWGWAVEHLSLTELEPVIEPLTAFYEIAGFLKAGEQAFWMAIEKHEQAAGEPAEQAALFTLWMHYSLFLIFEGRWQEAGEHLDRIGDLTRSLTDAFKIADTYQLEGLVLHHSGKKAQAVEVFKKAIETYRTENHPRRLIYALNHLGEGLSFLLKPQEALRCHEEALQISQKIGDRRMEALSQSHMGVANFFTNRFDRAIQYWEQAVDTFEVLGDLRDNGRTRNNLGYVYNRLGEYERAIGHAGKAVEILAQIGDRYNEANVSDTLGEAYFAFGRYDEARRYFENALQSSRELRDEGSEPAAICTNLASLEIAMGDYAGAEELLEQASELEERDGHPIEIANFLGTKAHLFVRTNRLSQALELLDRAIGILRETEIHSELPKVLIQKAELLLHSGKSKRVKSLLTETTQLLDELDLPPVRFRARLLEAQLSHAQGHTENAIELLEGLLDKHQLDSQQAEIIYTIWQISGDMKYAHQGVNLYDRLARRTPNVEYQERLRELQAYRDKEKRKSSQT